MPGLRPAGFAQALAMAQAHGAITALDIGPAIGRPTELDELRPLLPHVDYLIANRHELSVCSGESAVEAGAHRLLAAGAACVIVKQGGGGALLCQSQGSQHIPAFGVEVHSTVGAGDAFNAGFLFARQRGAPLAEAVRYGNAVAALVISSGRGILGCPTGAQVAALMAREVSLRAGKIGTQGHR
jgi:sugar/nucleoside kinase (ribokinase family)